MLFLIKDEMNSRIDKSLQTIYAHDSAIVSRSIAGEMILVPIRRNIGDMESLYTLNETAARIWELLDGQHSLAEVHEQMIEEYDIDPLQARQDLLELVENLLEQGVLVKV
jgi:hypothetical protein